LPNNLLNRINATMAAIITAETTIVFFICERML
jgi:hypothetical protein